MNKINPKSRTQKALKLFDAGNISAYAAAKQAGLSPAALYAALKARAKKVLDSQFM